MKWSFLICSLLFACNQNHSSHQSQERTIKNWEKLSVEHGLNASFATVFIAFDKDCPLCKWYKPVISQLNQDFSKSNVQWVLLRLDLENADSSVGLAGIKEISKDAHNIAKSLAMSVTPEVVLADNKGNIMYRGKIDDRAIETGKHKSVAHEKYLEDALTEWRTKGSVANQAFTKPIGCFIEYESKN